MNPVIQPFTIYSDTEDLSVSIPRIEGVPLDRQLSFVEITEHHTHGGNKFEYEIISTEGDNARERTNDYLISAARGKKDKTYNPITKEWEINERLSYIKGNIKTFYIPPQVNVQREYLTADKAETTEIDEMVEEGHVAITIIEPLVYLSDGDENFMYAARAYTLANVVFPQLLVDFGNKRSKVKIRYTILSWPASENDLANAPLTPIRIDRTAANDPKRTIYDENYPFTLVNPTMHISRGQLYDYSLFDNYSEVALQNVTDKGKGERVLNGFSNSLGVVSGGASIVGGVVKVRAGKVAEGVESIAKGVETVFKGIRGLVETFKRPNTSDRDFQYELNIREKKGIGNDGERVFEVLLDKANKHALVEYTIYRLRFPQPDLIPNISIISLFDDLTLLPDIGEIIQKRLRERGVNSYWGVASLGIAGLKQIPGIESYQAHHIFIEALAKAMNVDLNGKIDNFCLLPAPMGEYNVETLHRNAVFSFKDIVRIGKGGLMDLLAINKEEAASVYQRALELHDPTPLI